MRIRTIRLQHKVHRDRVNVDPDVACSPDQDHLPMKWSRVTYCALFMAVLTLFVVKGVSPWVTVSLGALAAYWTYLCTSALWHVASFRVAVWRVNLLPPPSIEDLIKPRKSLWWLANPKLDPAMDIATFAGVLVLPALLWSPLIYWLFGR